MKGTDSANAEQAEASAISNLDQLEVRFDIAAELAKTTTSRHDVMIRLLTHMTSYFMYNLVDDLEIPERITDLYKYALRDVEQFGQGKKYVSFTPIKNSDSTVKTNFRYGFEAKRTHNPYH